MAKTISEGIKRSIEDGNDVEAAVVIIRFDSVWGMALDDEAAKDMIAVLSEFSE